MQESTEKSILLRAVKMWYSSTRSHMGEQPGAQGLFYIVRLFCGHRKTSLWVNTARIVPQREAIVERFLLPYVISRSAVT